MSPYHHVVIGYMTSLNPFFIILSYCKKVLSYQKYPKRWKQILEWTIQDVSQTWASWNRTRLVYHSTFAKGQNCNFLSKVWFLAKVEQHTLHCFLWKNTTNDEDFPFMAKHDAVISLSKLAAANPVCFNVANLHSRPFWLNTEAINICLLQSRNCGKPVKLKETNILNCFSSFNSGS